MAANDVPFVQALRTDYALKDIITPTNNDVLCGRGGFTNNHLGNCNWRGLVSFNKRLYISLPKQQKISVAKSIVQTVRDQDPPGRFLQKNRKNNLWYDIGEQRAIFKTSQALREGAPELRVEIKKEREANNKIVGNIDPAGNPIIIPPSFPEKMNNSQTRSEAPSDTFPSSIIASQVSPGAICMCYNNFKPNRNRHSGINQTPCICQNKKNINWFGYREVTNIAASKAITSSEVTGLSSPQFHQHDSFFSKMTPLHKNLHSLSMKDNESIDVFNACYSSQPQRLRIEKLCHTKSNNFDEYITMRPCTEQLVTAESNTHNIPDSSPNDLYKNQIQEKTEKKDFNGDDNVRDKVSFNINDNNVYPNKNVYNHQYKLMKTDTPTVKMSAKIEKKEMHTKSERRTDTTNLVSCTDDLMNFKPDSMPDTIYNNQSQVCNEYKMPSLISNSCHMYPAANNDTAKNNIMKPISLGNETLMSINFDCALKNLPQNNLLLTDLSRNHSLAFSDMSIDDFTTSLNVFEDRHLLDSSGDLL